uniref:von Willebrand factor A domain-containing protein 5A n=1 Tax=Myotis lucifugus TaxID=59463 RepID=G1Q1J4_MYOLU
MVSPPCGLLTHQKEPVPLKSISVTLTIREFVAGVSATLNYENEGKDPLEAFFVFPMDEDSAVHSFEAMVDGKKIVAELQEKSEARTNYENAISQGHQAFLLEEDDQAGDIFSCNVGNLPPGSKAALTLKYVQELPLEADGALRYVLPAILNPRYQLSRGSEGGGLQMKTPAVPSKDVPYTLSLAATVSSQHAIKSVQCSSPVNPIEYLDDKTSAQISLADGHKFDRDVELLVYYSEVHTPSVAVEMGAPATEPDSLMGDPSAMVSFYPNIPEAQSPTACGEFVFLMDRSESMHCHMNNQDPSQMRIEAAKETLIWLLKSLPIGCYFNIFGFGTFFESFFPESVKYTQDTMEQALKRVKSMDADLGGTEILAPLKAIYSRTSIPGHPLQLFVFTDGEVTDTFSVIREVKSNGHRHRCLSFGIGEGASTSLIKGIARSGGAAEFITGNERMQSKAGGTLLQELRQPIASGIHFFIFPGLWATDSMGLLLSLCERAPVVSGEMASSPSSWIPETKCGRSQGFVLKTRKRETRILPAELGIPGVCFRTQQVLVSLLHANDTKNTSRKTNKKTPHKNKKDSCSMSVASSCVKQKNTHLLVEYEGVGLPCVGLHSSWGMMNTQVGVGMVAIMYLFCKKNRKILHLLVPPSCLEFLDILFLKYIFFQLVFYSSYCGVVRKLVNFSPKIFEDDPLVQLISLQKADGSWDLNEGLAVVLGMSLGDMQAALPVKSVDSSGWATVLAVIWLHDKYKDMKCEWELLERKAVAWIHSHAGSAEDGLVKAAVGFLKSSVDPAVFAP